MFSTINGRRQDPLSGGLCAQFSFQEVYLLVDFCGMYFAEGGNTKGWADAGGAGNKHCQFNHGACAKKPEIGIKLHSYAVT